MGWIEGQSMVSGERRRLDSEKAHMTVDRGWRRVRDQIRRLRCGTCGWKESMMF